MAECKCEQEVPALVFGTGITVLGTIRCLGAAGVPLYCLSPNPDVESSSRWYRTLPEGFSPITGTEDLENYLQKLPFEQAVLIPCSDDWLMATSSLPDSLLERFRISQPSPGIQEIMVDKGKFRARLEELHIPHPRTIEFTGEKQLHELLVGMKEEEREHFFLKPCDSLSFCRHFIEKAFSFDGIEQALDRYSLANEQGFEMLLQEFIPGPATNHFYVEGFVDRNGVMKTVCTRQRLRMHPPLYGNSSAFVSIPTEQITPAVDSVKKLLQSMDYRGIFSAEFKRDDRDGLYKLLEVNSRCWWYVEFPHRCGVNIPQMAYLDSLQQEVENVERYRQGIRAVYPYLDIPAGLREIRSGRLSAFSWFRSWIGARYTVWTLSDPMPALTWFVSKVRKVILSPIILFRLLGLSRDGKKRTTRVLSGSS